MLGRFLGSYFWGRVADRYGRVPVMHMGLCSIAFLSVAFGLSTTFSGLLHAGEGREEVLLESLSSCA